MHLSLLILFQLLAQHARNLGLYLDEKISFYDHINSKGDWNNIKAFKYPSKNCLLTIYKSFIRSHLEYCDIIYDQPNSESFCSEIEQIQYNTTLVMIGAIKEISYEAIKRTGASVFNM